MNSPSAQRAYIFTGPTLPASEACQILDAVYLPPAAQGDVYRVSRLRPQIIGIIDGYFDSVPSVWHKEILWAMREGIHVFGAASMGALRAAELTAFGMEGIGPIYEAYYRGELEDDDEVAIAHAAGEQGYQSFSVAMVNIRSTLAAAQAAGIIGPDTREGLVGIAKALFYPARIYTRMLQQARSQGMDRAELHAFEHWLPDGQIDQKRADAEAMLRAIGERLAGELKPKQVRYQFEHTIYWEHMTQTAGKRVGGDDWDNDGDSFEALLDEARLDHRTYRLARQGALLCALAGVLTTQQGQRVGDRALEEAIRTFRLTHELLDGQATDQWLVANGLDAESLSRLLEEQAQVGMAIRWAGLTTASRIVDQLRLDGPYAELEARALHKQRTLEQAGLTNPSLQQAGLTRKQLLKWYFERNGGRVPLDLGQYARSAGFRDEYFLVRALLREYCYLNCISAVETDGLKRGGTTHASKESRQKEQGHKRQKAGRAQGEKDGSAQRAQAKGPRDDPARRRR